MADAIGVITAITIGYMSIYDTHNILGFYVLIPALALAITGLAAFHRHHLFGNEQHRGGGNSAG